MMIEKDGSVSVYVGSSVLGQGLETTLAQVAADTLKLPFERVRILHGSTTYLREGLRHLRVALDGGRRLGGDGRLQQSARRHPRRGDRALRLSQRGNRDRRRHGDRRRRSAPASPTSPASRWKAAFATTTRTYSYGAHACHVAVDPRTGHVDMLDYVAIEDVGVAINPHIVHGQAIGALVQGLGGVFLDQIVYDGDAQMLNASLADYLVPLASDFSQRARDHHGTAPFQDQSARRQGRGRGRHGRGGGDHRQCGGRGARAARRRGARPAAVAGPDLEAGE